MKRLRCFWKGHDWQRYGDNQPFVIWSANGARVEVCGSCGLVKAFGRAPIEDKP